MRRLIEPGRPLTLLVAFALVGQSTGMAAPRPLELKWSELSSTIRGRTIKLTLPEGATVSGEVIVVREDSLVVNVRKTSDSKAYPKGSAPIPRASVTVLSMTEDGRWGEDGCLGTLLVLAGGTAAKTASSGVAGHFRSDHRGWHARRILHRKIGTSSGDAIRLAVPEVSDAGRGCRNRVGATGTSKKNCLRLEGSGRTEDSPEGARSPWKDDGHNSHG